MIKGYSIWDPEGGQNGKKNKIYGGSAKKLKYVGGSAKKPFSGKKKFTEAV